MSVHDGASLAPLRETLPKIRLQGWQRSPAGAEASYTNPDRTAWVDWDGLNVHYTKLAYRHGPVSVHAEFQPTDPAMAVDVLRALRAIGGAA